MMLITKIIDEYYDLVKTTQPVYFHDELHKLAGKYTHFQNVDALGRILAIEHAKAKFAMAKEEEQRIINAELKEKLEELELENKALERKISNFRFK